VDSVAGNNFTQTNTVGTPAQPVYTASAINGLVAGLFTSATPYTLMTIGTAIPTSVTTYSWYAVLNPTTGATLKIFGGSANGDLRWYISSTGHQGLGIGGGSTIATGTATLASGTWVTIAFTYNSSTGAAALYKCSAGTCSSDGTATVTSSPTVAISTLGIGEGSSPFKGDIAEIGYYNGISISGVGSWSSCEYGI
jgi:hypothetical protein